MRLRSLTLANFGPHRHLRLDLAPLTIVTGNNGAGKSHIAEALRLALTGDWMQRGLTKKGQREALLSDDGATDGFVVVEGADGLRVTANLKSGRIERTPGAVAHLDLCCDPHRIAAMPPDELRAVLANLLRIEIDGVTMSAALIERGHAPERVERWLLSKDCAAAASEARGAWRVATGEVYGHVKAETWVAPAPSPVDPLLIEVAEAGIATLTEERERLREEAADAKAASAAREKLAALRARANDPALITRAESVDRLRNELAAAEAAAAGPEEPLPADLIQLAAQAEAARDAAKQALRSALAEKIDAEAAPTTTPCPYCAGGLIVRGATIVKAGDEPPRDQERIAKAIREHAIGAENARAADEAYGRALRQISAARDAIRLRRAQDIANARQPVRLAERAADDLSAARAALEAAEPAQPPRPAEEVAANLANTDANLAGLRRELDGMRVANLDNASAAARTARAREAHLEVLAWTSLGEAVEALPAELLARGLEPLNTLLAELAAGGTGWLRTPDGVALVPQVSPDMAIRCGHRPYHSLSKSERWRIDALLGAAVASLSGHRLLVLDEADLLQPSLRPALLGWLDAMAKAGHIETVLVMATTKEPFKVPAHVAQYRLPAAAAGGEAAA